MENEKWIGGGMETGDVDCRKPPEQGEGPTLAEVVTLHSLSSSTDDTAHTRVYPMACLAFLCSVQLGNNHLLGRIGGSS